MLLKDFAPSYFSDIFSSRRKSFELTRASKKRAYCDTIKAIGSIR
jgi:hypothetical protein